MRIRLDWLAEFVELPPLSQLCEHLTQAGIEVERTIDSAQEVEGVVVARVADCRPHPSADNLHVCDVFDGVATHTVVCGAPNVAQGLIVAYARPGAVLPAKEVGQPPLVVAPKALRGVTSAGMLCARSELGLAGKRDEGLWTLPEASRLGEPIFTAQPQPIVLELSITPNRPDCLSHLGIAREVAAATGKRLGSPKWRLLEKGPDITTLGRALVDDTVSCRRFVARVIRQVRVGPSPLWLVDRLEAVGQRSVNNVVDATNYVMLELGQPLHAYDLATIGAQAGCPTVRVRASLPDERITTLDGQTRTLKGGECVVADSARILALAGVMGGRDSEVTQGTSSVFLEAAYFDPTRVRQTARGENLRTEASLRFERGADIGSLQRAVDRCAQLLSEISGGEVAKGALEVMPRPEVLPEIALRPAQITRLLGISLQPEAIVALLEPLEIRCVRRTQDALLMMPPSFRPDLVREVDLIEEVARRFGYAQLPERLPDASGPFVYDPSSWRPSDLARASLLAQSMAEVVTYGFAGPQVFAPFASLYGEPLRLTNPLGEDTSALRTTLLPGLLKVAQHNSRHTNNDLRLFEVGTCFRVRSQSAEDTAPAPASQRADGAPLPPTDDRDLPREDVRVAILLCGLRHPGRWYGGAQNVDLGDAIGVVELLLEAFDPIVMPSRVPKALAGLNPFAAAELCIGETPIGIVGQASVALARSWGLTRPIYLAEISLTALLELPRRAVRSRPLPRYPKTRRDLALVIPPESGLRAEVLRSFLAQQAGGALGAEVKVDVRLFDRYRGKPLADGEESLAFALEYQSSTGTLTDVEVNEAFTALQSQVKKAFPVEIRAT